MELKKEYMQVQKTKSSASIQVTFDTDYNVPDAKADIGRMIQNKGIVTMDEVRLSEGRAFLKGVLHVDFLYVAEGKGTVSSFSGQLPFEETMNLEGITTGDKLCLKWEIEDLRIHVIHSRKMNIKSIVVFQALVEESAGIQIPVAISEEAASVKKKKLRLMSLKVQKKDTLRVREEITLSSNRPNISELLWYTVQVRGLDMRPDEKYVQARGELFVFVLYKGEDKGPLQWAEYILPFTGKIECGKADGEMIPNISVVVSSQHIDVKPDADGEERILAADMVLELDIRLYKEEECEILQDIYMPMKDCILSGKEELAESLLIRNFSRCRVTERAKIMETQGKILQICHSDGKIKVEKTRIVDNGILAEGILSLQILYIVGNDEIPFYSVELVLPFSQTVEARKITPNSNYYLQASLEQLSVSMTDGNEVEVRATIGLNTLVLTRQQLFIIDHVEERELDKKVLQKLPGIQIYIVKEGDTLWDIAKHCHTTMEEIMKQNNVTEQSLQTGQKLLIMKKIF